MTTRLTTQRRDIIRVGDGCQFTDAMLWRQQPGRDLLVLSPAAAAAVVSASGVAVGVNRVS